ncbi:YgcG family protein [Siphonobacter sp. SORGH_AS_1065]|uniref:TPM domain-containing protein n=1 Tax=Siphonobacter sp. SORGH_AS_1065 TaxID=3041795 RepID=UPI002785617E|nr:TPM domain-containing protein [Siphonobacter sp. SORGH_AS_1065]MDQ1087819.1 uncharacterized protein [Siphonobacter sp. SORGH_AS_1065]
MVTIPAPFFKYLRKGLWLFFSLLSFIFTYAQDIPERPVPARLVNDYVGMLSGNEKAQLERKLKSYMDSTSTQIVILVVKTTGDYPPGDYAFEVGRRWGIGQKGKNNGLIILWATQTRKLYIATGYGMEGSIPDAVAKQIVSNTLTPAFREQQYYQGLDQATTEIIQRASGEYKSEGNAEGDLPIGTVLIFLGISVVVFIFIARSMGNSCRNSGGPGAGMPWFGPYTTMGGWGSSSGSWGGGSSGGGGFDFGGGSFGGGGAGGDY